MTESGPRLVVVDSVVVDVVLEVDALPERGSDTYVRASSTHAGGGFNVLAAATRLGLPCVYAGAHGTGPFATIVAEALQRERVGVALAPTTALDTGFVVALIDGDGERTFLTSNGAESRLTTEQLHGVALLESDVIYFSGYVLLHESNAAALFDLVQRLPESVTLLFDPGPLVEDIPDALLTAVLARADWLSCNAREAVLLSGVENARQAATTLNLRVSRGGAIVRTGADGCVVATNEGTNVIEGFHVRALDSNGAGDCHVGAFAAFTSRGMGYAEAARLANAAAASSVTRKGPATGPTREEFEGFLRAHSF